MGQIRCDWLEPDGEDLNRAERIVTPHALVSIWRALGLRRPPGIGEIGDWLRAAVTAFTTELHVTWLQHPPEDLRSPMAADAPLLRVLAHADRERNLNLAEGATWLTLVTASRDPEAKVRRGRHEAIARRAVVPDWLALRRLNARDALALAAGLSGLRQASPGRWPKGDGSRKKQRGIGHWFDIGRELGAIQLGRTWLASVCVVGGPTRHRPWSEFRPINAPCWLHFRVAGDAHQRFAVRGAAARILQKIGNEPLVEACDALESIPRGQAVAISIAGLAGGATPAAAKAAAAALAAQLESWLGVRTSLQASAADVLALCVPGFVAARGGARPPAWAASGEQAGALLPFDQPASPWVSQDLRRIQNWVPPRVRALTRRGEAEPTVIVTDPPRGRAMPYAFDLFGRQPSYVSLLAGASGSGKSLSLARIVEQFTQAHPQSPVRILDVGRSAEPLARLWRAAGVAVATPDLTEVPDYNPLLPPFPLLAGGALQASAVKAMVRILLPRMDAYQEAVFERVLQLVWEAAARGHLEGRGQAHAAVEAYVAAGQWGQAREAHAEASATFDDILERVNTGPVKGAPGTQTAAAADQLAEDLPTAINRAPGLLNSPPPEWQGALRVVAELGAQADTEDPLVKLRYALGLHMLTGDLIPDDWKLASAPGPAAGEHAAERARALREVRKIVICDEAHRLAANEQAMNWSKRLAREGRKARLALILASQAIEDFDDVIIQQASLRMLFGDDPGPHRFGLHPDTVRPGVGNLALVVGMADGHIYQSRLRVSVTPEHLWALASGVGERALIDALAAARGSRTAAIRELARRLPDGRVPPDAPSAEELVRVWDTDRVAPPGAERARITAAS